MQLSNHKSKISKKRMSSAVTFKKIYTETLNRQNNAMPIFTFFETFLIIPLTPCTQCVIERLSQQLGMEN